MAFFVMEPVKVNISLKRSRKIHCYCPSCEWNFLKRSFSFTNNIRGGSLQKGLNTFWIESESVQSARCFMMRTIKHRADCTLSLSIQNVFMPFCRLPPHKIQDLIFTKKDFFLYSLSLSVRELQVTLHWTLFFLEEEETLGYE